MSLLFLWSLFHETHEKDEQQGSWRNTNQYEGYGDNPTQERLHNDIAIPNSNLRHNSIMQTRHEGTQAWIYPTLDQQH